jgi:hypothetical protein
MDSNGDNRDNNCGIGSGNSDGGDEKNKTKKNTLHRLHPTKISKSAQPPPTLPIVCLFGCCRCRLFNHCRERTQWRVVGGSSYSTNYYVVFTLVKIVLVHCPTFKPITVIVPMCLFYRMTLS